MVWGSFMILGTCLHRDCTLSSSVPEQNSSWLIGRARWTGPIYTGLFFTLCSPYKNNIKHERYRYTPHSLRQSPSRSHPTLPPPSTRSVAPLLQQPSSQYPPSSAQLNGEACTRPGSSAIPTPVPAAVDTRASRDCDSRPRRKD